MKKAIPERVGLVKMQKVKRGGGVNGKCVSIAHLCDSKTIAGRKYVRDNYSTEREREKKL